MVIVRCWKPWVATVVLLCGVGRIASATEHIAEPASEPQTVKGGTPAEVCAWPTTVSLEGSCTGTLVHPQVVIYAAHCGSGYDSVELGEEVGDNTRRVRTQYCRTHPDHDSRGGHDFAFCVLEEPQLDIPIVPPLMGCETTILTSGREVLIVGFGRSEDGYGEKRVGVTEFGRITSDDEAFLGGGGIDACQGDSGGPVYVRLATADGGDDTWRVFGITSYGDPDCLSGGYYSMMHIGMEWFEEESGFDLTPCHDADGTWRPGPSCRGFPKDPGSTHGTWSNGCAGGPQGNWSSVCGAAFDPSNDKDAPSIAFVTPRTDVRLESDPSSGLATTTIELEANDGDGYGIQAVELLIDGKSIPSGSLEHEPYSYSISFPRGVFSIQATAVDFSANMAQTDLILIGVDMDPVPSGDSDTDAGSTGSETTSDFGTTDSGASSSSSAGSAASEAAPSGKGCGCRTGTRSTPFWGLLMLCFGLRGRRAIRMIPRVSR